MPPLLALSSMTVPDVALEARIVAAAAAGFDGIGLRAVDRRRAHESGFSDADLRSMLATAGLSVVELDVVNGWGAEGDRLARARRHEGRLLEVAEALGGRTLTAVGDVVGPRDRVAEVFAGLCDRAAEHGLAVGLEYLPWTNVGDLAAALRIVRDAGRPNAGVVIDSWHHFHGDPTADLAAVAADEVVGVQVDDSGPLRDGVALEEQTIDRLLPGEGTFDLVGFLTDLRHVLTAAPLSVEVISPRLSGVPPSRAIGAVAATTRSVLAQVRW